MTTKRSIKDRIQNDVYFIWDNEINGVKKARNELRKMFLQEFDSLIDIDEQRLLLHDLTTSELKCIELNLEGNIESARLYAKTLKDLLDNCPNYKNTRRHKQDYAKALNNYVECYKNELSKEELIEIYEFCYETYKRCDPYNVEGYLEKSIAELNLNLLKRNFNKVFEVAEDMLIHNNTTQYKEALQELMAEVKKIDALLHKQILLLIEQKQRKTS